MLALGVVDREVSADNNCTAFLVACGKGSAECIGLLADAGCDTAAVADAGNTALI